MAKHLDRFIGAFADSRIPFFLAEVLTNGGGDMMDLIFRFVNRPGAALLGAAPEAMKDLRFTRAYTEDHLKQLEPLAKVAFSGSAASFTYETVLGRQLRITCYQPVYGMAACILEEQNAPGRRNPAELLADSLPGGVAVLEMGPQGIRILSFNRGLCQLTRFSRKEFFNRFAQDAMPLIHPDDRPGLLQHLMDAARDSLPVNHDVRLLRKDGENLWVNLRADLLPPAGGASTTFYAVVLDIDQHHREREALAQIRDRAEELQQQYTLLLNHLPGGFCVFRTGDGGGAELVRVSRGLCEMTGYSETELLRRRDGELLRLLPPDDREAAAAAVRDWQLRGTLQRTFRVRTKGGGELWLSAQASACRLPEGPCLVYAACADVGEDLARQNRQRFRSELADLVLEDEDLVLLDYDPARDLAHLEWYAEGRRTERLLPEYRKNLPASPDIHPGDRKRVQSALRQALSRPVRTSVEYLGKSGGGYRWYRAVYTSLTDGQGNVCRVVGKLRPIDKLRAAAERFAAWADRQRTLSAQSVCFARLDLTADRLLDAKASTRFLTRALFGNTADECLGSLSLAVPDGADRAGWQAVFDRSALLDAFRRGEIRPELEHRLRLSEKLTLWVHSAAELAENPQTGHTEAFLRAEDINARHRREQLAEVLSAREFDLVATVDVRTGRCRVQGGMLLPEGEAEFAALVEGALLPLVLPEDRATAQAALSLSNALRRLRETVSLEYSFRLTGGNGGIGGREFCRISWLDDRQDALLLTIRPASPGPENG